jgi:basic membrane lipoprotein Med (substrate-binding protein (PBP1-ABC) superfamily)
MSVIPHLATSLGRRDEVPNQELARDLAAKKDQAGIREIAENLWNKDKSIQADCIKVLYEVGSIEPQLIADYAEDFAKLLRSKNNRLVWGGMTALAEVAKANPDAVFKYLDEIKKAKETGSVITVDNAIATLATVAAAKNGYNNDIFPYLLNHLSNCRPKEVPQHSEKILQAVNQSNKADFIEALEKRIEDLSGAGLSRVQKVTRQATKL